MINVLAMISKKYLFIVFIYFVPFFSFGYFENKYYCYVNKTSIIISLHQDIGFEKCITLSRGIDLKIYDIDDNIAKAEKNISKKEDVEYWIGVKNSLNTQKNNLIYVKDLLNKNIDVFENGLFIKIKKLLNYYLTKEKYLLEVKIDKTKYNLTEAQKLGNLSNFEENIKNFDKLVLQKDIIEKILNSSNFEEMMPYLKYYLKNYNK